MTNLSKSLPITLSARCELRQRWLRFQGPLLILLLGATPLRDLLESSMSAHMLVQLPLLVFAGATIGVHLRPAAAALLDNIDRRGIATVLLALFALAYWMLPRSLDAALASEPVDLFKFLTVPLLIGLPASLAWSRLPVVARGFVYGNLLSMLVVLGWLYLAAPVRVCNFYLTSDQTLTGKALLLLAALASGGWLVRTFTGLPAPDED